MYMEGSNMGIINSNLTKLGSFLGNEKLYIPEYQRGYSWEETQLDDFWQDLKQIYEENTHDEHFLGQVIIQNKEDGKRYIIDGQQRISNHNYLPRISCEQNLKKSPNQQTITMQMTTPRILMLNILAAYLKVNEKTIFYLWVVLIKHSSLNIYKTWCH